MHIQVSHLSKSFGSREVLRDVSFTLGNRERAGLLGKNGSGKSTLFKILTGEETADDGYININPKNSRIGYLPQVIDEDNPLSSGEKLKVKLREILDTDPEMLILDEPTNHLDYLGMQWLEKNIRSFGGPVLLVSHDRYFLDRTMNRILELEEGKIKQYGGNYSFYRQQKQIEQQAILRSYEIQQDQIRKLENDLKTKRQTANESNPRSGPTRDKDKFAASFFANRVGRKFGKNIQAVKNRLESIDIIDKPEPDWKLKALFAPVEESSRTVAQIKAVSYRHILDNVMMTIERGQRVAITGTNGSGKTTLVKLILGQLVPDRGEIITGNGVQAGYLSQEHSELDSEKIVLEELAGGNIDRTESFKLLRRFLLPAEKINQPVRLLSSGEKAKLLLAKIMVSGANFIILDEPTNHLDIPSREAVEKALADYAGTLLVISHDRYFLQGVGMTDYYEIGGGRVKKI